MIADLNKRICVAVSEAGTWNVRAQYHEAPRSSLVERVFSFLEQYPVSRASDEDVAPSLAPHRTRDDRG
jgi:hypothetical protein